MLVNGINDAAKPEEISKCSEHVYRKRVWVCLLEIASHWDVAKSHWELRIWNIELSNNKISFISSNLHLFDFRNVWLLVSSRV